MPRLTDDGELEYGEKRKNDDGQRKGCLEIIQPTPIIVALIALFGVIFTAVYQVPSENPGQSKSLIIVIINALRGTDEPPQQTPALNPTGTPIILVVTATPGIIATATPTDIPINVPTSVATGPEFASAIPSTSQSTQMPLETVPQTIPPANTSEPKATLVATLIPTVTPSVTLTSTTIPTNTRTPSKTPAPTQPPTSTPGGRGSVIGGEEFQVSLVDYSYRSASDEVSAGAVEVNLLLINNTSQEATVVINFLLVRGADNVGNRYGERNSVATRTCLTSTFGCMGLPGAVDPDRLDDYQFTVPPQSTDPISFELQPEGYYEHDIVRVGLSTDWIDLTIPSIQYRLSSFNQMSATWRLSR